MNRYPESLRRYFSQCNTYESYELRNELTRFLLCRSLNVGNSPFHQESMQLGEIRAFAAKRITRAIPIRWVVTLQPCLCAAKKKGPGLESYRTWMVVKLQRWETVNFCGLTMGSHCPRLTKEQNMVGENGEKSLSWIMLPIWSMGRLYIYLHGNHKNQPTWIGKYTIVPWIRNGFGAIFTKPSAGGGEGFSNRWKPKTWGCLRVVSWPWPWLRDSSNIGRF